MKCKCPSCYAEFDLAAALDSDAGREFVRLMSGYDGHVIRALTAYLGLFRSASRALSWDRVLRLTTELIQTEPDPARLSQGLHKATEALRQKQRSGDWKPLANHNYLKNVLAGLPQTQAAAPARYETQPPAAQPQFTSRTSQAMLALKEFEHGR